MPHSGNKVDEFSLLTTSDTVNGFIIHDKCIRRNYCFFLFFFKD